MASLRVKEAIRVYKAQVVVADSAVTNLGKLASHPLLIKPGTEGLFIQALVKAALEEDLVDADAVGKHPAAFSALKQALAGVSLESLAAATGLTIPQIKDAVTLFAEAPRSLIICGEGLVRRNGGYRHALALIDLLWITGKLGRPGCGLNTAVEEANEQGAVDMGVAPEFLPGQAAFEDEGARAKFAKAWEIALPASGGSHLMDILRKCRSGEIKALYLVGENPLATLPASSDVRAALEQLDVLICQDPFMTESAQLAHFVLPACTFAEKDGTVTNQEGQVQRVRQTMDPRGESLPDWHILSAIGTRLGRPMEYESAQDIQSEIMKLLPGYYNLGQAKKQTPTANAYLADGYADEVGPRYSSLVTRHSSPGGPFALTVGQLLYHSGKLSTRASGLMTISPNSGRLRMSPQDMERMGLADGAKVRVTSSIGRVELGVQSDPSLPANACFFPEHFNEPPVKDLIPVEVDPVTGVPTFKQAAVSIEKA